MRKVIPAILTKDVADLENKLKQLQGLTDWVQIDIMDRTLVDNSTITLEDVAALGIAKNFSLETHLMVLHPENYFLPCQNAGIKRVIFHLEAGNTEHVLSKAGEFNFEVALALNPETPVEKIVPYINSIDVAVLMSVNPGLQGQEFILQTLDKIKELKKLTPELLIEVDGGINLDNIKSVADAGADCLVVGKGLFGAENIQERFKELKLKIS